MAPRKAKSTTTTAKVRAPAAPAERRAVRQNSQAASGGDPNRLLREAAWSQMFGRVESKNPFAR
jgi:hypothetical protein